MLAAEGTAILPHLDGFNTIVSTHPLLHDRSNLLSDAGANFASYLRMPQQERLCALGCLTAFC